jgi:hypothetical protein
VFDACKAVVRLRERIEDKKGTYQKEKYFQWYSGTVSVFSGAVSKND